MAAPRAVVDSILSLEECGQLISICQAISVRGYRPGVTSATLHEVACTAPELLVPLVRAYHFYSHARITVHCQLHQPL